MIEYLLTLKPVLTFKRTTMQLEIFKFRSDEEQTFSEVRTIEEDGKVLFYSTDVAKVLGYSNLNDAVIRHCKSDGVVIRDVIDSMGRPQ